jgi:hypothetical protein
MTAPVVNWLQGLGYQIKREFSLPWGVCDVAAIKLRSKAVERRLSFGQGRSVCQHSQLHLLSLIPDFSTGSSVTLSQLRRAWGQEGSESTLLDDLEILLRHRFLTSPTRNRYQKLNGWAPLQSSLLAVELKLQRISEVINQAVNNQSFADKSYIGLPSEIAMRLASSEKASELRQKGLGLLAVESLQCRVLIRPAKMPLRRDQIVEAHCVERFWRTRDNSSSTA